MSTTFLFVHGAWHGGWCWRATERALQAKGHETHAPTLTGLGERLHLAHAGITPDSHVEDILAVIKWRELNDIALVGHSYGGLIISGVASQVPEKIKTLVYLDAFAPEVSGRSIFADANPERMTAFEAEVGENGFMVEPDLFEAWTDDPKKREWLRSMCTPHPIGSFRHGVTLTDRRNEIGSALHCLLPERAVSVSSGVSAHSDTGPLEDPRDRNKTRCHGRRPRRFSYNAG